MKHPLKTVALVLALLLALVLLAACGGGSTPGPASAASRPGTLAGDRESTPSSRPVSEPVSESVSVYEPDPEPDPDPPAPDVEAAPDFTIALYGGGSVTLSELRGKPVFLNFFATWCPPCKAELPDIQQIYENYGDVAHILVIDIGETEEEVAQFLAETGYSFPMGMDPDNTLSTPYDLYAIPQSYFLDANGAVDTHLVGMSDYDTFAETLERLL